MSVHLSEHCGLAPTRLADDPSRWLGPSSGGSRRHRYALDEHERLLDPRCLR